MALKIANNAVGNLAAPMTTGDTTLTLQSGQGARFPVLGAGDWHPVTVVKVDGSLEIMRATARTGDILTVSRAQEGTTALAFSAADLVQLRQTRASYAESLQRDGTVAMTGNLDLGTTNKIINLAAGTVATDAVNKGQLDVIGAGVPFRTGFRNLAGQAGGATITHSCDVVWLRNAAGDIATVVSGNTLTLDLTTQGANGRDQAANFNGQWIYTHYIWNGTTLALLASASRTSPTLPSGYTHWAFAYALRIGSTNNNVFISMYMRGGALYYPFLQAIIFNGGVNTGSGAMGQTSVFLPPIPCDVGVQADIQPITGSGNAGTCIVTLASTSTVAAATIRWAARVVYGIAGVSGNVPAYGRLARIPTSDLFYNNVLNEGTANCVIWVTDFIVANGAT